MITLKSLFVSLIFTTLALPAFAAEPATTDKVLLEEVESMGIWLNNFNLEFMYRNVVIAFDPKYVHNVTPINVCYKLGQMNAEGSDILWDTQMAAIDLTRVDTTSTANKAILEKVKQAKTDIQIEMYNLEGYCTYSPFAQNPVAYGDHQEFYKRFVKFTDDFIAFQNWAWYDVQGKPQAETAESLKAKWLKN